MSEQTAEVEQFDGFTPEGSPMDEQSVDTFADSTPIELEDKGDSETKEPEAKKAEEKDKDDQKQTMDSADELEEKEAGKDGEKKAEEKPADKDAGKEDEADDGKSEEKPAEKKPEGKTIRLKAGDEPIDIPEDATIAVKVDGKKQFVSVADLRNEYAGKQSWDKRFQEFDEKQKEFTSEQEKFTNDKKQVVEHFGRIGGMIKDIYEKPDADPAAALRYLVDTSQGDVLHFEKRMMEHYGSLAEQFSEMSEAEQKLYWSERKNQILLDSQANRAKIDEDRNAQEERQQSDIAVRKEYGVSDKEFEASRDELGKLGYDVNGMTAKQVCEYHELKPHAEKAESVCSQFEEDLGDDEYVSLIQETTVILRGNTYLSPEEAVKLAGRKLGFRIEDVNDDISELNEKVKSPANRLDSKDKSAKKVGKSKDDGHVESFDDYEDDYYSA